MLELLWFIFVYIILPAGLAYLGGQLLAQDAPEADEPTRSAQSTSWNPRTTQSEGLARPRAYGKNMHHGNLVSRWTDVDGDQREILYLIVEHGDGPTKGIGSEIVYLNDQPAGNFGSVVIQERLGTMDQTVMAGFEKTKLQHNIGTELVYNEAQTFTIPNDFFDDLEYMVSFPRGLYRRRKNGSQRPSSATLQVRVRPVGGAWVDESPATFSASSLEPLYYNFKLSDYMTIARGTQYEIEFKKITAQGDRHVNSMSLRSVREVVDVAFTRPGKALIGIKAIATAQLSGNIDVKVIREDRIINVYNGDTWSLAYSNNRAWVVWDILTQPSIDGNGGGDPYSIERYDGIDPAYMDLNFFYAWSLFCEEEILDGYGSTEARSACNYIVDEFQDAFSLAKKIAAVGRARIYWAGDKLTGWIDTVVTTPTDLVTMDSIIHKSWKNNWAVPSELAGVVEVLFQDSRLGYEKTSAEYSSEDAGGFRNIVSLEGVGLTSRGPVVHYAKYNITRNELIRNTNEFMVAKDGFRYSLGDVIRLQSRPANWGEAYRVMSSTVDTITVDRDVTGDVTAGDVLHIRSYDTITEQVVTDTYEVGSVSGSIITATINWDVTPVKGNLVATGPASAVKLRRIIKLQATTDNFFKVTVETYDVDLFDADDIDPNNPNVNYQWAGATPSIGAPVTRAELDDLIAQIIPPQPNIDVPIPANLTWEGDSIDTVTWSKTDANEDITFRYASDTDHIITPDSTTDTHIYWNPSSPTVFLTTNLLSTALSGNNWLMAINEDGVVSTPNPQQIMHGGLIQAGTITANQIIVTGLNVLVMQNAPAEAGADVTGAHEGDISIENITDGTVYKKWLSTERTKLTGIEALADVTGDNQGDISIENITDGTVYKKYLNTEKTKLTGVETGAEVNPADLAALDSAQDTKLNGIETSATIDQTGAEIKTAYQVEANAYTDTKNTKLGGVETGADVTGAHPDDIIYYAADSSPPSHLVGRLWYDTTAGKLKRSNGTVWNIVGDETSQHQGDISLANLAEKSVDSLVDGTTYKKFLNTERTKLTGVATGADVTGDNTAANITGQGDLATIDEVNANVLNMTNAPAEAGADVTGGRLALINSSLLPNWRLDNEDVDTRPAGIYPIESISDFSQLDWLDGDKAEIKILSTPDTTVVYGFPAIPIDEKQKYKIVIRHKSSAASANGLFLQLQQYNLPLPVGKTHIGHSSGGPNVQLRTNVAYIASNIAMPGTSWVVDEYTYTPSSGTKYASFGLVNWNPATAEVEYHVDYVLMYLIPKTADEIDESGSRYWAGETGADVTASNTAANITGQGALATKASVDLATGEVTNKSLANLDSSQNTKLNGVETGADVTAEHADDVIYRGNNPPAHKEGRIWYCLENGSYDNYTLYRSTSSVWVVISDTTAQHQADIQLANVSGDSDDIAEGTNFGKMPKDWKRTEDVTLIDGGKIYTKSITAAVGAIDDLAVDTLQIAGNAVTVPVSTYTAGIQVFQGNSETTIITADITVTGSPIQIVASFLVNSDQGAQHTNVIKVKRDSTIIYSSSVHIGGYWQYCSPALTDSPGAGSYTYSITCDSAYVNRAINRSLLLLETKK